MYNAALHPAILENFWLRVGPFLLESGDEETFLPTQTLEAYTRNNMTLEKGQLEASQKHSSSKEVIVESSMKWYQMCTSHIHEGDKRTRQRTTDAPVVRTVSHWWGHTRSMLPPRASLCKISASSNACVSCRGHDMEFSRLFVEPTCCGWTINPAYPFGWLKLMHSL